MKPEPSRKVRVAALSYDHCQYTKTNELLPLRPKALNDTAPTARPVDTTSLPADFLRRAQRLMKTNSPALVF